MDNNLFIFCEKHKAVCSILFFYFGLAFTWILSIKGSIYERITMSILSGLMIGCWIFHKNHSFLKFVRSVSRNKWILASCSSLICAGYHCYYYHAANFEADINAFFQGNSKNFYILLYFVACSALPIYLVVFAYLLKTYSNRITLLIGKSLKNYGIVIIGLFCFLVFSVFITYICFTDVFYNGYNAIFSADSQRYIQTNVFMNLSAGENDIRQPLFGLIGSIFTNGINLLSLIMSSSYPVLLTLLNVVLILMGYALLSNVLDLSISSSKYFFVISMLTYPSLIFSLLIEQYTIPFITLMIFTASIVRERRTAPIEFIAASGSLITTAALFPFLKVKNKTIMFTWIKTIAALVCCFIITGRFPIIRRGIGTVRLLLRYAGGNNSVKISFIERFWQYSNFIWACLFKPNTSVIYADGQAEYMLASPSGINYAGLLLLVMAVTGFLLNRHLKIARLSFYWLISSMVILCIIGWGTVENNLVLYSLYFSWSLITLLFLMFEKLVKSKKYKSIFFNCVIFMLICQNLYGLYDIIKFGTDYYPLK